MQGHAHDIARRGAECLGKTRGALRDTVLRVQAQHGTLLEFCQALTQLHELGLLRCQCSFEVAIKHQ